LPISTGILKSRSIGVFGYADGPCPDKDGLPFEAGPLQEVEAAFANSQRRRIDFVGARTSRGSRPATPAKQSKTA
jgi:hypothetical protein